MAHRNIKPAKIVIDYEGKFKIVGFGNCLRKTDNTVARTFVGILKYMSPQIRLMELGEKDSYDPFKGDVFALGMTLYAMASLDDSDNVGLQSFDSEIRSKVQSLPYSPKILYLLSSMLSVSEEDRPSMQSVFHLAARNYVSEDIEVTEQVRYHYNQEMHNHYNVSVPDYKVNQTLYCSSLDSSVKAFQALKFSNRSAAIIIYHELSSAAYKTLLPKTINTLLNFGLEQARSEVPYKVIGMQIDLSNAPEKYSVLYVIPNNMSSEKRNTERTDVHVGKLREYLNDISVKLATLSQMSENPSIMRDNEPYHREQRPFYVNKDETVKLFHGISKAYLGMHVVIKHHTYSIVPGIDSEKSKKLNLDINAGLVQARVEHPHICRILQMYLSTKNAPRKYSLDHILEALSGDVWKEIEQRQKSYRPFSEREIWNIVKQISSALAYVHSKVNSHLGNSPQRYQASKYLY